MKKSIKTMLCLSSLISMPLTAFADGPGHHAGENSGAKDAWQVTASVGLIASPSYLGDDETQISALPIVRVEYGDKFFAGFDGIGYNFLITDKVKLGAIARYEHGRQEDASSPVTISGSDTKDLIGLGDVDGTLELGGYVEYSFLKSLSAKGEVRQGLGGHEGLVANAEVKYNTRLPVMDKHVLVSFGPILSYGDENYNSTYFDVNAQDSLASGLSVYDAGGGLNSVGMEAMLMYPFTKRTSLAIFGKYDVLQGDIANSSLVQERGSEDQVTAGVFLNYRF